MEISENGEVSEELEEELKEASGNDLCTLAAEYGIFLNDHTLEVDLFNDKFNDAIIETLREGGFGAKRSAWIEEWAADPDKLDVEQYLSLVEAIGKGRFAQRLVSHMGDLEPPSYIGDAIGFVAERV